MLNELNDKKVITYDVNSNDKEIQLLTTKTSELVKTFVNNKTRDSVNFSLFKYAFNEEDIEELNFLFNDNKNVKLELADLTKSFLKKHYKKIDLKNMSNVLMDEYIEAVEK